MRQLSKCNGCAASCSAKEAKMKSSYDCTKYVPVPVLKTPLLVYLLGSGRSASHVIELLTRYEMSIERKNNYPYFGLRIHGKM